MFHLLYVLISFLLNFVRKILNNSIYQFELKYMHACMHTCALACKTGNEKSKDTDGHKDTCTPRT